jgi:hypothetical protein
MADGCQMASRPSEGFCFSQIKEEQAIESYGISRTISERHGASKRTLFRTNSTDTES